MSFSKAEQLLQLATLASSRRQGVTLDDISETFSVSHRTAQRMARALETQFPDVETHDGDDGRKRWRLARAELRDLITISAEELAAMGLAATHFERTGMTGEAKALRSLEDKVMSLIPRTRARIEPDYEAILAAQGFVARPGPKPRIDQAVQGSLIEAIKACRLVNIKYQSNYASKATLRKVAPLGFLSGMRRYLVAQDPSSRRGPTIKTYRADAISAVEICNEFFTRPIDFDLQKFAHKAFGVFQRDEEITDIVWRFHPQAAEQARSYLFHPDQTEEIDQDGSLVIKFRASGFLEMAWYLYQWGDKVAVIEPPELRELIRDHQRNDFVALP